MRQILQNLKTGATEIIEVPCPPVGRGQVLIRTACSLVSTGTERMVVDFGKAGLLAKARQQPEKVKQVLDKIKTDGVLPTLEAVSNRLDEPISLGYCNAGIVLETGDGVTDLHPGDRVISNGPHAEVVSVPKNLCAGIPEGISNEEATFTVLGSIALQGIRLAKPTLGERFMVFGLGLVGLLSVQLLRASGCSVLAIDISRKRLKLAESFGADIVDLGKGADPVSAAMAWTKEQGADGGIIAASAKGDEIIHQAAQACRKRGRIILVGVVGLNIRRNDFYEKELTFQVSCSYGPGRYDEKYEKEGQDYPMGFVRWTGQRNFEAFLDTMQRGQLQVKELITHRLELAEVAKKYDAVLHDPEALGIIIQYPIPGGRDVLQRNVRLKQDVLRDLRFDRGPEVNVGIIGAGAYARSILLPALARTRAHLVTVADINGAAATHAGRKFGAERAVSDYRLVLDDPEIQAVFILVEHHLHAQFACEALKMGKHVFVEKPLALNNLELNEIDALYTRLRSESPEYPILMVGFNRRFSPHVTRIRQMLEGRTEPLCMNMTVNAGYIPPGHWTQDPVRGGGRIIGEGCHFIDLLSFVAGSPVSTIHGQMVGGNQQIREDKMSMVLGFADGSVGTINYFASGSKSYPKESLEIFGNGRVIHLDNFRTTKPYGFRGYRSFRTWRQDKGHHAEVEAFLNSIAAKAPSPIPFEQIVNVTRATFSAIASAKEERTVHVD